MSSGRGRAARTSGGGDKSIQKLRAPHRLDSPRGGHMYTYKTLPPVAKIPKSLSDRIGSRPHCKRCGVAMDILGKHEVSGLNSQVACNHGTKKSKGPCSNHRRLRFSRCGKCGWKDALDTSKILFGIKVERKFFVTPNKQKGLSTSCREVSKRRKKSTRLPMNLANSRAEVKRSLDAMFGDISGGKTKFNDLKLGK